MPPSNHVAVGGESSKELSGLAGEAQVIDFQPSRESLRPPLYPNRHEADTGYITIAPHNPNGPVCAAASMHIAASIPNFLIMEEGNRQTEQYDDIFLDGWNHSLVEWNVPESPGLGIDLTPEFLREFTVAG